MQWNRRYPWTNFSRQDYAAWEELLPPVLFKQLQKTLATLTNFL